MESGRIEGTVVSIDPDGNLNGYVCKHSGELVRSEAIVIGSDSYAPVFYPGARPRLSPTMFADIPWQAH